VVDATVAVSISVRLFYSAIEPPFIYLLPHFVTSAHIHIRSGCWASATVAMYQVGLTFVVDSMLRCERLTLLNATYRHLLALRALPRYPYAFNAH